MASCGAHVFLSNRYLYLPRMKIIFLNLKLNFHSLLIRKNTYNIRKEIVFSYKCLLSVDCTMHILHILCMCSHKCGCAVCMDIYYTCFDIFIYNVHNCVQGRMCVCAYIHTVHSVEIKCGSQGRDCSCKYPDSASFWQP